MVLFTVEGDFSESLAGGLSDDEIVNGCLAFLNTPPPRKKYAKKTPQPLYGSLGLVKYRRKVNEETGETSFSVVATTSHRKSRNFWGIGRGK